MTKWCRIENNVILYIHLQDSLQTHSCKSFMAVSETIWANNQMIPLSTVCIQVNSLLIHADWNQAQSFGILSKLAEEKVQHICWQELCCFSWLDSWMCLSGKIPPSPFFIHRVASANREAEESKREKSLLEARLAELNRRLWVFCGGN